MKAYDIIVAFLLGYVLGYLTLFQTEMSSYFRKDFISKHNITNAATLRDVHNVLERSATDCAEIPVGQTNVMNKDSYLLVLSYFEQMNNALSHLFHLGPVAMNLDLKIVEPFVVHSRLYGLPGLLPSREVTGTFYSLSTLFNIESIKQSLYSYANASLVSFEDFILYAPRDIVVVYFIHKEYHKPRTFHLSYRYLHILKLVSEAESPFIDCTNEVFHEELIRDGLLGSLLNITTKYGAVNFRIAKLICVAGERDITTDQLKEELGPEKKTVIFPEFRGCAYQHCNIEMRRKNTTHVRSKLLYRLKGEKETPANISYVNSDIVMETASLFIKSLNLTKQPYISVYMRIEKLLKSKNYFHVNETYLKCCTSVLQKVLASVKKRYKLSNVLLITDLGKYGTDSCVGECQAASADLLKNVEKANKIKVFNYDPSKTPLKIDNSGFAALVEMEMLAGARRLITIGSGLFKRQLTQSYEKRNIYSKPYAVCKELKLNMLHDFTNIPSHC